MNVEVRHLKALAAIGDEGTITDAALALRVSQPALSRTLDQLERRLGTRLVERTTRSLALTAAGKRLWEHAHRILNQLDDALAEASADAAPRPLRAAFAWAMLGKHTVPLLRAWRERWPEVPVEVRRVDDPEGALRRGEADVAFLRSEPSAEFAHFALTREQRMVAVPEQHPLADKDVVFLADLVDEPVVLCSTAATSGAELWPETARPHVFQVPGVYEWLTTVATGEAVGVTTEGTSHSHPHPGVHYLALADADPVTVHLAWPSEIVHPATSEFCELVRRQLTPSTRQPRPGG
ncbi:LysR family transcriptional regulator [Allokutzneria sp. A3M-2-11 16]|uniref:LysR family transcriptional regulator n=1 Tax=Allokutzneria sp. A3M-2-11 16 TaxID=2962043 RepID=UPI0020B7AC68|nr:LysR family transcriptional regulator [Allokutzneria sp. A3M-2-11 16]MCP3803175.1 LysR family transcriptional regulator [Allokutzneria sp. A3M-2-11 16]